MGGAVASVACDSGIALELAVQVLEDERECL